MIKNFLYLTIWVIPFNALLGQSSGVLTSSPLAKSTLLKIKVEDGNISLKSSGTPGKGFYKTNNSALRVSESVQMITIEGENRVLSFDNGNDGMVKKNVLPATSLVVSANNSSPNLIQAGCDPSISTDFNLHVMKGTARLDFSGMNLNNVQVKGGNSDIFIDFNQVNKGKIKQINIHDGMGKIVVRNPENANAALISLKNDHGDICFVVGGGNPASGICNVYSSIGNCVFVIDKTQPVKIVIRKTILTTLTLASGFQPYGENTYVNGLYLKAGKGMLITCDKDAGSIEVIEN